MRTVARREGLLCGRNKCSCAPNYKRRASSSCGGARVYFSTRMKICDANVVGLLTFTGTSLLPLRFRPQIPFY